MRSSDQINELAAALAKVQGNLKPALKDSENPAFKTGGKVSKYADLTSVWEACREGLAKNDIAVMQAHDVTDAGDVMITRLTHKSGQWVESHYPLRPVQNTPQGFASATTYARRISLASMVGVVADDDDGQEASQGHRPQVVAHRDEPPQQTMAGRKNEAQGQRTASQYKADCIAALAKIKTNAELTAWSDAERETLEKLEKASRDAHTAIMDKVAETADRVSTKRAAAE